MTVGSLQSTDSSLVSSANAARGTGPSAKANALSVKAQIVTRLTNLDRVNSWFCPSSNDPKVKAYAATASKALNVALNELNKAHGLSSSWAAPVLAATTAVGLGAAHYFEVLTPAFAKVANHIPKVSLPSFATVVNGTKTAFGSAAVGVSTLAASSWIPSASATVIGLGAVAAALAIAYVAKQYMAKPKQA